MQAQATQRPASIQCLWVPLVATRGTVRAAGAPDRSELSVRATCGGIPSPIPRGGRASTRPPPLAGTQEPPVRVASKHRKRKLVVAVQGQRLKTTSCMLEYTRRAGGDSKLHSCFLRLSLMMPGLSSNESLAIEPETAQQANSEGSQ